MNRTRKSKTLDAEAFGQAAECLKVLAHPQRLQMVRLLLDEQQQYSVNDLAEACEIPQPQASDHLRLMQRCGFLYSTKDGRTVYYSVAEPHLASIMACIEERFGK